MKKALNFIWGLFKNNLVLKIMAVLFAVILWSYVLAETDPVRERVQPDVRVAYQNQEQLEANGLAISQSLSEMIEEVNVRYEVNQSDLKYLGPTPITATVDLSQITGKGEVELKIEASGPNCRVIEISPSTVTLTVEDYVPKDLPVAVNVTGSVADGYYASVPVAIPEVVTLFGARGDLDMASSAVCNIDLTGLTEWNKKSMDVTILDSEGNALDRGLFDQSLPSVIIDMSILPKKTVPVDVASAIFGKDSLAPGYEITDMTCNPAYVEIVGTAEDLAGVASIALVPYSIGDASSDVVVSLDYAPPEGVTVLGEGKAQVTITIREKTRTETYEDVSIDIRNLGGGLHAELAQSEVDVTVLAGISKMSKLHASDIVPYVDLNGLGVGTYTVDILFEIPEGFMPENFSAVTTVTITITRG